MLSRPSAHTARLALIWTGMPVFDVTGRLAGSVRYVKPATPAAGPVTNERSADEDLDTAFARALSETESGIAPELAEQLIRRGFLKVRGPGLMDHDRYVLADQITLIDDDAVRLSASVDELTVEREQWI